MPGSCGEDGLGCDPIPWCPGRAPGHQGADGGSRSSPGSGDIGSGDVVSAMATRCGRHRLGRVAGGRLAPVLGHPGCGPALTLGLAPWWPALTPGVGAESAEPASRGASPATGLSLPPGLASGPGPAASPCSAVRVPGRRRLRPPRRRRRGRRPSSVATSGPASVSSESSSLRSSSAASPASRFTAGARSGRAVPLVPRSVLGPLREPGAEPAPPWAIPAAAHAPAPASA